jgi:hypothetical protein
MTKGPAPKRTQALKKIIVFKVFEMN